MPNKDYTSEQQFHTLLKISLPEERGGDKLRTNSLSGSAGGPGARPSGILGLLETPSGRQDAGTAPTTTTAVADRHVRLHNATHSIYILKYPREQ